MASGGATCWWDVIPQIEEKAYENMLFLTQKKKKNDIPILTFQNRNVYIQIPDWGVTENRCPEKRGQNSKAETIETSYWRRCVTLRRELHIPK